MACDEIELTHVDLHPASESEELFRSCRGRASDFFQCDIASFGDFLRDQPSVGRLAPFSAIRDRRQIWAIRFDHEFVHRHLGRDFANLFPVLKRHDSREGNEMTEIENFVCLIERAAKTMKHAANLSAVLPQNPQCIVPRVALMNHNI